jgi:2,4-dienoyl-CoA reductase-like NADH-dependent reductase (Old Yellow Enzyme family)
MLNQKVQLRSGSVLRNRVLKAAMSEGLASDHAPSEDLLRLYGRWASENGPAALVTGNIQVDRQHLERAANLVLDDTLSTQALNQFSRLAAVSQRHGALLLAQLSHAGRATLQSIHQHPLAPSAVQLRLPGATFGKPQSMSEKQVETATQQFVTAASLARAAGFGGVEIHAAHGYLVSQFLSPLTNLRQDAWGGSLENRSRFLLDIVKGVRAANGPAFVVGVKLNASDFQRGGFSLQEAVEVARFLDEVGVDFLEITGGTYERLAMASASVQGARSVADGATVESAAMSTEAFFVDYAAQVKKSVKCVVAATGGFRSRAAMEHALASGAVDLIGVARPMCAAPDCVEELLTFKRDELPSPERTLSLAPLSLFSATSPLSAVRRLNTWGTLNWFSTQMRRVGKGQEPDASLSMLKALRQYSAWESAETRTRTRRLRAVTSTLVQS